MSISKNARAAVMARDADCRALGLLPGDCHGEHDLHHVLPRGMGGGNRQKNLIRVCRRHHDRIHHPFHEAEAVALGLLRLGPLRKKNRPRPTTPERFVVPYLSTSLADAWPPEMSAPYAPQNPPFVIPVGRSDKAPHGPNGCVYPPYVRR